MHLKSWKDALHATAYFFNVTESFWKITDALGKAGKNRKKKKEEVLGQAGLGSLGSTRSRM